MSTSLNWQEATEAAKSRETKKRKTPLMIGLACLGTAVQFILFQSLGGSTSGDLNSHLIPVVVAKKNLSTGDTLNDDNTKFVYLYPGDQTTGFISAGQWKKYEGLKAKVDLPAGTPLFSTALGNQVAKNTLTEKIPIGKRLFLLEQFDNREMLSTITAGDKVDIIAQLNVPGYGSVTETVLSGIPAVSLNGTGKKSGDALAFYLTVDQVKIISFMKNYGTFSVALRNPNDDALVNTDTLTFTGFLQNPTVQKLMKKDDFEIVSKY